MPDTTKLTVLPGGFAAGDSILAERNGTAPYLFSVVPAKVAISGSYADLLNPPAIPAAVGQLTNDLGYQTVANVTTALLSYAPLASPALSGTPTGPTAVAGTSTVQLATTAFVAASVAASTTGVSSVNTRTGAVVIGSADVTAALTYTPYNASNPAAYITIASVPVASGLAPLVDGPTSSGIAVTFSRGDHVHPTDTSRAALASPQFSGVPLAPTAVTGNSSQQLATTAFVGASVAAATAGVSTFNTRTGAVVLSSGDVTAALTYVPYNAANPSAYITAASLAPYAPLASPALTGTPTGPTAATGNSSQQLANTAFVAASVAAATTGVSSFNTRTGAVALASGDVTLALTYTPYDAANPAGYITSAAVPAASAAVPLPNGAAAVGTSLAYTREGHVHPSDTTRYAASNPAAFITAAGAPVQSVAGRTGAVVLAVADVLGAAPSNSPTFSGPVTLGTAGAATINIGATGSYFGSNATYNAGFKYIASDYAWYVRSDGATGTSFHTAALGVAGAAIVDVPVWNVSPAGLFSLLSAPLPLSSGGTGAVTPAGVKNALGLATVATTGQYADLGGPPAIPAPSAALPLVNGAAAAGTSLLYAREGHVHPSDPTNANLLNNASLTGTTVTISAQSTAGANGIEFGSQTTVGTTFLDWHSSGSTNDYDVRTGVSGGIVGTIGIGTYFVVSAAFTWNGNTVLTTQSGVSKAGDLMTGELVVSPGTDKSAFRLSNGTYGVSHYAGSTAYYILITPSGSPLSTTFATMRPFHIDYVSGIVSMDNGLAVLGGLSANTLALAAPLPPAQGGTGAASAPAALVVLGAQPALGFTPVQQGSGIGQIGNLVAIGWSGTKTKITIDNVADQGNIAMEPWVAGQLAATPAGATAARSFASHFGDRVSVLDWGAVGDGTTDDTAAIQAALDTVPNGTCIAFPPRTFKITAPLRVGNGSSAAASTRWGITLRGQGPAPFPAQFFAGYPSTGTTKILYAGPAGQDMFDILGPLNGWGLSNMYLDGGLTARYGLSVLSASNGESRNLSFTNIVSSGLIETTLASYSGFGLANSMHNAYDNLAFNIPNIQGAKAVVQSGVPNATPVPCNSSFARFTNITIFAPTPTGVTATSAAVDNTTATYGFYLQWTDTNFYQNIHYVGGNSNSAAVLLDYTLTYVDGGGATQVAANLPSSCTFIGFDVSGNGLGANVGTLAAPVYNISRQFANNGAPNEGARPNYVKGVGEINNGHQPRAVLVNTPFKLTALSNLRPDLPQVVDILMIDGQTAPISNTAFFTPYELGIYRTSFYLRITGSGDVGSLTARITCDDGLGSAVNLDMNPSVNATVGATFGTVTYRARGGSPVNYSVVFKNTNAAPTYSLNMSTERIG